MMNMPWWGCNRPHFTPFRSAHGAHSVSRPPAGWIYSTKYFSNSLKKLATICKVKKKNYICHELKIEVMKTFLKKLAELAAVAVAPVIIDLIKELLDDLKKKVEKN